MDNILHNKYTGVSNTRIHKNLKKLIDCRKDIELRIPLIYGVTDTDNNLNDLINFISTLKKQLPVTLLPYNPLNQDKLDRFCLENKIGVLKMQTSERIFEIKQKFIINGIDATIGE